MTGVELLKKLVPLIPSTYTNLTRFPASVDHWWH